MLSIGTNPTVGGKERTIEVNIFDFDADLYDSMLEVKIIQRLRSEEKFENLTDLIRQMELDKVATEEVLKTLGFDSFKV